jgi:hypothetical protein
MINGIQSDAGSRTAPVISQFIAQNNEFLSIVTARFGHQGFCQNLLRLTMRNELAKIRSQMAALGNELLDKAKLFFNKEISLFSDGQIDRNVFFSSLATDTAEVIGHCMRFLETAIDEFSLMVPHAMAVQSKAESDLDTEIASALGYKGVQLSLLSTTAERTARQLAASAVESLANTFVDVAQLLTSEAEMEMATRVQLLGGSLRFEGQRLRDFQTTISGNILDWEIKRHGAINQCHIISTLLSELSGEFTGLLGQVGFKPRKYEVSRALTRRIQFGLMQKGSGAKDADRAASEFTGYLRQYAVDPKDMIPGEARKIQGNLGPEALGILQDDLTRADFQQQKTDEKRRSMQRSQLLGSIFDVGSKAANFIVLVLSVFLLESCGLKLSPKSELLDFRPEIPFLGSGFYFRPDGPKAQTKSQSREDDPAVAPGNTKGVNRDEQ